MTTHDDRLLVVVTTWLDVLLTMTLAGLGVYAGVYDRIARAVLRQKQGISSDVAVGGERGPVQPLGRGR